ncbi:MAG: MFS transporter [Myxococcales bacterium]|nr:MFS transporter [Myxococcales bacterium]
MKAKRNPSLGAIFLTIVLDLLGFGLVIPFLAEEARDGFGTTAFVGTLLGAIYSLMQFLFVPIWGRLSDRVGRRPILVWSVFASGLTMLGLGLGLAYGHSVAWLFAARAFGGIATANLGTASAYIADITTPKDRARGMGMVGMAFGIGFILGPAMGGLLAKITVNRKTDVVACFAAAALSLVNFIWVWFGLPESLPPERRARPSSRPGSASPPESTGTSLPPLGPRRTLAPIDMGHARAVLADAPLARAILVNFLIVVAFTNLDQTFRYLNKDAFGMDQVDTGILLAFIGVVAAVVQGGLIRPLTRRYAEASLVRVGTALQCLAFAGIALSPSLGRSLLYAASGLLALGNGITQPTVSAFVSKRADATRQGAVLGTNQSFAALARVIGPAFGGYVYGAISMRAPYIAGAIGMGVALLVAMTLRGDAPGTPAASVAAETADGSPE